MLATTNDHVPEITNGKLEINNIVLGEIETQTF